MTFIPENVIEARSAELWTQHGLRPGFDIEWLLDQLKLDLLWEEVEDSGGSRILGQLLPDERRVVLNERHRDDLDAKGGRLCRFTIGHEIGHWFLHAEAARSGALTLLSQGRTWCRDKSRDPIEVQAELFSAALLIPHDLLKAAMPKSEWRGWATIYRLADEFMVNATPMIIRLEKLGWAHRDDDGDPVSGPKQRAGQETLFGI